MQLRSSLLALLAAGVFAAAASAQNRVFTSQYSFGDSLSDNGNAYALSGRTIPPSPPYFNGRVSNGPVFTELLGQTLTPAFSVSSGGLNRNFAVAGATAGTGSTVPNLGLQVAAFGNQVRGGVAVRSTDLFTVLAGANDLIAVLSSPATPFNLPSLDAAGSAAAQAVATNLQALVGLGARNLVVAGLPNLGATPRSLAAGGAGGPGATFGLRTSAAYNVELRSRLAALAAATPDLNLVYVDLQGVLDRLIADARTLGYANTSSFFLAPAAAGGGVGDPNSYIFWDDIHPTARTHAVFAAIINEQLNPEPVLGFAGAQGTAALALQGLSAASLGARLSQVTAAVRPAGRADVYASYQYGDGNRGAEGWRPKFAFDASVVTAGADLQLGEGFLIGGAINRGELDATVSSGRGTFGVETGTGRLYALWQGGPVSLLVDASYGSVRVKDVSRRTAFGGLAARSKTSGDTWGAGLRAGWVVDTGAGALRPFFSLRTERVRLDATAERDLPALAMNIGDQQAQSTQGAVGVDFSRDFKLAARAWRLDLRGAWHGEIGAGDRSVTGRLVDNFTRPTAALIEDGDGSGVELGGAVTVFFAKNWSASLGYTADLRRDDKVTNRGLFSIQTGF
ncbi:MAG: hypothetical protein B9S34_08140 [Opitutia bacterium Tous-C1TDCM]|nr:MAG: hypothetical protein B9S34_08140 [Opitutae bacterium Tous-C1TDCM]